MNRPISSRREVRSSSSAAANERGDRQKAVARRFTGTASRDGRSSAHSSSSILNTLWQAEHFAFMTA